MRFVYLSSWAVLLGQPTPTQKVYTAVHCTVQTNSKLRCPYIYIFVHLQRSDAQRFNPLVSAAESEAQIKFVPWFQACWSEPSEFGLVGPLAVCVSQHISRYNAHTATVAFSHCLHLLYMLQICLNVQKDEGWIRPNF